MCLWYVRGRGLANVQSYFFKLKLCQLQSFLPGQEPDQATKRGIVTTRDIARLV